MSILFEDWDLLTRVNDAFEREYRTVGTPLCDNSLDHLEDLQAEFAYHMLASPDVRKHETLLWKQIYAATVIRDRRQLASPLTLREIVLRYPADINRVPIPSPAPTLGEQLNIARQKGIEISEQTDDVPKRLSRLLRAELSRCRLSQLDVLLVRFGPDVGEWPDEWVELLVRLEADPWLDDRFRRRDALPRKFVIPELMTKIISGARKALSQRMNETSWDKWFIRWIA